MYILNRFPFFRVRLILFVKKFKTKGLNNPIKPTCERLCLCNFGDQNDFYSNVQCLIDYYINDNDLITALVFHRGICKQ